MGQIRWVTAAPEGYEGWTSLNSAPKAGLRWEAGQVGACCCGSDVRNLLNLSQRNAGTAQLGIDNYLHFCSGTWALLAMEGCRSTNWRPLKLEWGLLPSAPCHIVSPEPPLPPRLNREHKESCEMNWSDKVEVYNIDDTCARYTNESTQVQFYPHSSKFEER